MELTDLEEKTVTRAARDVMRRFRGFVEFNDLRQEAYLWVYGHQDRVEEFRQEGRGLPYLDMRLAIWRYAAKQKAAALGFEPDDLIQYSPGVIEIVLRDLLLNGLHDAEDQTHADEWGRALISPGEGEQRKTAVLYPHMLDLPVRSGVGRIYSRTKNDPSTGGNQLVSLIDVKRAFKALPTHSQNLLADVVVATDLTPVANKYGITVAALRERKRRALKNMQTYLNDGATP